MAAARTSASSAVSTDLNAPLSVHLPGGLHPFLCEQYTLTPEAEAPPFFRLEGDGQDLAFHLVDPFQVIEDYQPEIPDEDDRALGLKSVEDALVLSIVNLTAGIEQATVNLAAPLVINVRTGTCRQVILRNAAEYAVRHPLLATE